MKSKDLDIMIGIFVVFSIIGFSTSIANSTAFALTEFDRDYDGIPDEDDECPQFPETYNKFQDTDGCPDSVTEEKSKFQFPDSDGDGFEDRVDKCVNHPETFNGYLDDDGCPEIIPEKSAKDVDSDSDSVPDPIDACPDEKETINGFKDGDGCPDSIEINQSNTREYSVDETQCRDNKVPVLRINAKDTVCVTSETAKKWEKYNIATIVETKPDVSEESSLESEEPEVPLPEETDLTVDISEIDLLFNNRSDNEKRNIENAVSFLSSLGSWNEEIVSDLISDDFVQHNPTMPGDKLGTIKKLKELISDSSNSLSIDIKRIYSDGNFVIVHSNFQIFGKVNAALIDIFKFSSEGKIIEHWDVMQEIPSSSSNENTMFYLK